MEGIGGEKFVVEESDRKGGTRGLGDSRGLRGKGRGKTATFEKKLAIDW